MYEKNIFPDLTEDHQRAIAQKYVDADRLERWRDNPPARTPAHVHAARLYWRIVCNVIAFVFLCYAVQFARSDFFRDALTSGTGAIIAFGLRDVVPDWFVRFTHFLEV